MNKQRGPLEEIASDWFVNRKEELDLFWQWATNVPERVKGSYALIGLRRTGKTAILHRLFNRLFNEQEKVLPVYISFGRYVKRAQPITAPEFVDEFVKGYIRSYLAFRYRLPELFDTDPELDKLAKIASELADSIVLQIIEDYKLARFGELRSVYQQVHWAISVPKGIAWGKQIPTALIVDEFQVLTKVYNPDSQQYNAVTNGFQQAAETHWAPMLVSGSSVSMMVGDALGGMLSGRFSPWHLEPLTQEYAIDMIFRIGQDKNIPITEELALVICELTQGYPYPIERLMNSTSSAVQDYPSLEALQQVLLYELTEQGGSLRSHYRQEYGKYIHELNGDQTTRKVLLWIIKYPERRIFADEIAAELQLEEATVQESLEKLNEADIITSTGWYSYKGPADPMLRRYIEYNHAREVEKLAPEAAASNLLADYRKLQGEMNRRIGHLAEIIVGGVMHNFDGRSVDGANYFNIVHSLTLPKFAKLERRGGVIKEGIPKEIDLIGEWRVPNLPTATGESGIWLVSVRHRNQAMGEREVHEFLEQTKAWLTERQTEKPFDHVTLWYVSKLGFTRAAIELLQSKGVYYSDLGQFNQLAQMFGFLPLTV